MALLFLDKVPGDKTAFAKGVKAIASKYKINPNWPMALMNSETGGTFKADQYNLAGSGAVGLVQFMPSTAKQLGYTIEQLANMTNVQQLAVVDEYLDYTMAHVAHVAKIKDYDDLYLLIFYPAAVGQPADHVIFTKGSTGYSQNAGMDMNNDGKITIDDFRSFIRKKIPAQNMWEFVGRYRYQQIAIIAGIVVVVGFVIFAWYKGWLKKWFENTEHVFQPA